MPPAEQLLSHHPESILFVLDVDAEVASEAKGCSRLQALQQCIALCVHAKRRLGGAHRFALATLTWRAELVQPFTASAERFLAAVDAVAPSAASFPSAELGSLVELGARLGRAEAARGARLRVVLLYARSSAVPAWTRSPGGALAADALYLHGKPEPGVNQPQAVYNVLEDSLDAMSCAAGHTAYIFESSAASLRKAFSQMLQVMAHPAQRVPQAELPPAVDLASAPSRSYTPGKGAAAVAGPAPPVVAPKQVALPGAFSYSAAAQVAVVAAAAPQQPQGLDVMPAAEAALLGGQGQQQQGAAGGSSGGSGGSGSRDVMVSYVVSSGE